MRLNIRNKIIELIPTIIEGITYAQNAESHLAIQVLDDCINAISSIFNSLESGLSENRISFYAIKINSIIEKIMQMKTFVNNGQNTKEISYKIENLIISLKGSLLDESEVKLEIVFLPYKSSMWDSMESIWRAAKDDPRCNCHVVPIPYYVNTEKNDFSTLEYEGDNFNEEVPVTHFKDYDISVKKPDIIYFHNPYDEYNTLTRVPTQYYSRNLVKYTNMLVYCPYFVSMSYSLNKDDKINNFYKMPGIYNSHKVICQSVAFSNFLTGFGFDSSNLLTYGSPKIDSVIYNLHNKNYNIPKEWIKKLQGKKVFLLNTKIFHFSIKGQETVEDLENLIHSIIDNPNCALIWRPHPLARSGIKKYTPDLYNKYVKLEESVEKIENCILDTTSTYLLSFILSDALISDGSSIINNYLITKKPIYHLEPYGSIKTFNYFTDPSAFYIDYLGTSITDFRDMILNDKDYNLHNRLKITEDTFPNLDGKAGERIHSKIYDEVYKK
ncbi:CDP-glycerol glycerophosphotransferase family protein [Sedimentibacter sp. MB31-C6]|uniref:CDP-glycerol glycerophosphotransferase family protein n=1 Tax=Sedimentibacter sp. MB31-C6 TaxID=3109366 RepID=UPI002DDD9E30|nr:CDP-glycerol glycerophosphotransferase family protein [Sedimentibacter sp. MB36-C1]WSI04969.1 CDP-glycerol glycerophosphotransferase family protein [Sedimentibacter sp. MB36-C1]